MVVVIEVSVWWPCLRGDHRGRRAGTIAVMVGVVRSQNLQLQSSATDQE